MASAHGARTGAVWGADRLTDNQGNVLAELNTGYGNAQSLLGQGRELFQGMTDRSLPGVGQYDALTLGSGEDIQRRLEGTGGYQFNMDQGLQALARARSAGGMLASGNTDTDAMSFASGLASNTLNSERQALLPYLNMYQQGTAGQAGVLGAQAGLATDHWGNRASVMDNTTKSIVGLGTEALKAGDAAKSANQSMMMSGLTAGLGLLGSGMGSGGFFTKMAFGGK
jgi:hypothetical protein